ncbi:21462_t:CDS:2 [Entrophospora sp. SA101]|nr:21462_t:CDS:2 [Entrophospora sp. SA101]
MYPNGVSHPDKNYIGLFLKAIPTDHERENNSSGRERTYAFEIYPDPINKFDLIVRVRITNEESIAMLLALQEIPYGEFPLASQIPKYFDDDRFCDVEFSFSCGLTIKAHKIILASQSKYFENMLSGQWIEGRNKSASMGFVTNRWDELKSTVNMQRVIACNNVDWIEELIAEKIFGVHEYGRNK